MLEEDQTFDPVTFWFKKLEELDDTGMKSIAKYVLRLFAIVLSSAFSESVFSYGGDNSENKQSRAGPIRLTARMFVKYNFELIKDTFLQRFEELLDSKSREELSEANEQMFKEINNDNEPENVEEDFSESEEEGDADAEEDKQQEEIDKLLESSDEEKDTGSKSDASMISITKVNEFQCPGCKKKNWVFQKFDQAMKRKGVKCDGDSCKEDGVSFELKEQFLACQGCHDYDLCIE